MPIDQAGNGARALGVVTLMVAVALTDGLKPSHPTNGVLNDDAKMTEQAIKSSSDSATIVSVRK